MSNMSEEDVLDFAHRMYDLARSGNSEELAAYVDAGVPVDMTNDKGDTLLMLATYHDHPETMQMLLTRGADAARVNNRGQTALAAAVFRQSPDSVAMLLAAGADPAAGEPSALEMARQRNLPEMLTMLDGE